MCGDCEQGAPFERIGAAFVHGGAAQEAIVRLKFRGRREVARILGPLLAHATWPLLDRFDVVAPIPLHATRRRERGYDQARLLAAALAAAVDRPLRTDLLARVRATERQMELDREERLRNLEGAFVAAPAARGLRIALVDDVITTGATSRAAADALRAAGAASVCVVAFCRAGH